MLCFSLTAQAQAPQGAEQFLQNLYDRYQSSTVGYSSLGRDRRRIFSPSLVEIIRADERRNRGYVGTLDFDPICDCQDDDGLRVSEMHTQAMGKNRAKVEVTLNFRAPGTRRVTVDMVQLPMGWRVDDVAASGMPSMRKLLETAAVARR